MPAVRQKLCLHLILALPGPVPAGAFTFAGAMIFVVIEEIIPESQKNGNTDISTAGVIAGFLVMMILDVAFG